MASRSRYCTARGFRGVRLAAAHEHPVRVFNQRQGDAEDGGVPALPRFRRWRLRDFLRADQGDGLEILGILVRELVHAALPVEDSHGKKFKAAAARIGLVGKMRAAVPGRLLEGRLHRLLDDLGPLPHAALDITWSAFDKPKRQTGRMLKATCAGGNDDNGEFKECGYTVRLASKWAKDYGVHCPKHGAIAVEFPPDDPETELDQEPGSAALAAPARSEGLSGHDAAGS